jgi:hypothetical protein
MFGKLLQRRTENRRSEAIRRKQTRKDGQVKPVRITHQGIAQPTIPPVMVRSTTMHSQKTTRRPRRRIDLPLNLPGVALRLPAMPGLRVGWRAVSGFLSFVLGALLIVLWSMPQCHVQAAQIEGLQRISSEDVNDALGVAGQSIFMLDSDKMAQELQITFPELGDIAIDVTFPAEVYVYVSERQPVLAWKQSNRTVWVDAEGVGFFARNDDPALTTIFAKDSPTVALEGMDISQGQFLPKEMVGAIQKIVKIAPSKTPILYDRQNGLGWEDKRGWKAYFGTDFNEIDLKMSIYETIVNYVTHQGVTPNMINVAFVHAPFYRLEQQNDG